MRISAVVAFLLWLLAATQISLAHDIFVGMPEGGLGPSIFAEQLNIAIEKFVAAENGGYMPSEDELKRIGEIFAARGGIFNEGFFIKISDGDEKYTSVVYFYLFASGLIQWSIESWEKVSPESGDFIYRRWKFRPDMAFFTMSLQPIGGTTKDLVYEEANSKNSPVAVINSRIVLNKFLEAYKDLKK